MAAVPPPHAAAAYRLESPTEADLLALLTKTAGVDASEVLRRARADAHVPPGPLSLDGLERVARAVVAAGVFPTTISARSFLVRLGSFRALSQKSAPAPTTSRLAAL
jgi:hypothetical protein